MLPSKPIITYNVDEREEVRTARACLRARVLQGPCHQLSHELRVLERVKPLEPQMRTSSTSGLDELPSNVKSLFVRNRERGVSPPHTPRARVDPTCSRALTYHTDRVAQRSGQNLRCVSVGRADVEYQGRSQLTSRRELRRQEPELRRLVYQNHISAG